MIHLSYLYKNIQCILELKSQEYGPGLFPNTGISTGEGFEIIWEKFQFFDSILKIWVISTIGYKDLIF